MSVHIRFANMPFAYDEQDLFNCRRLQAAVRVRLESAEEDPGLRSCFIGMASRSLYLMHGGTRRTNTPEFEVHQRTVVRIPKFMGRQNMEMSAVADRDEY